MNGKQSFNFISALLLIVAFLYLSTYGVAALQGNHHDENHSGEDHSGSQAPAMAPFSPDYIANVERSTHTIGLASSKPGVADAKCSAVAVSADRLLTATHCEKGDRAITSLDGLGVPASLISKQIDDGHDHLLIIFSKPLFNHWVKLANRMPFIGEPIFSMGYSYGSNSIRFHAGYVSSYSVSSDRVDPITLYQLQNYFGDSGSGIFDQKGELLATESQLTLQGSDGLFQMYADSVAYQFKVPIQDTGTVTTKEASFVLLPNHFCTTLPMKFQLVADKTLTYLQAYPFLNKGKNAYMILTDRGKTIQLHVSKAAYASIKPDSWLLKNNGKVVSLQCP